MKRYRLEISIKTTAESMPVNIKLSSFDIIQEMEKPRLDNGKIGKLKETLRVIASSKKSDFYKKYWGLAAIKKLDIDFVHLPNIGIDKIINCKFNERLYVDKGIFVKIIYRNGIPFLMARTKNDIGNENYGEITYERPLIFFENAHESLEKSLWHYGKNILPLIGEDNIDITLMSAGRYKIDSIVGDMVSIKKLVLPGTQNTGLKNIRNITIIDSTLNHVSIGMLGGVFRDAKIQKILALPETGSFGQACKETNNETIFHETADSMIETGDSGELIVTKLALLPTPIIKYTTGIEAKLEVKNCHCEEKLCFSLKN